MFYNLSLFLLRPFSILTRLFFVHLHSSYQFLTRIRPHLIALRSAAERSTPKSTTGLKLLEIQTHRTERSDVKRTSSSKSFGNYLTPMEKAAIWQG